MELCEPRSHRMEARSSAIEKQVVANRLAYASKQKPLGNSSKAAIVFVWDTFEKIHPRVVWRRVARHHVI
jgi:hypothetical protein